ncbi:hypothetical protein LPJ53_003141 [Coemansia erecta]|uniref:S-adenosyl-L-methionine-dependent methyltransferase n=1 Tax=Coemansia erecta TaxID=147472 RepID=A0A9W8CT35_9FUNG|nr:hypothetical protein LPJ53_003141 [Coemansia erecta]
MNGCIRGSRRQISTSSLRHTLWSFMDTPEPSSVYRYAQDHLLDEPPQIAQIRQSAVSQNPSEAQKMISPLQGAFLAHLVCTQGAARVLELGCYKGYSACWLAHGLLSQRSQGSPCLWTCERDREIAQVAQQNIKDAGYSSIAQVVPKAAQDVLESWDSAIKLDMVFIDANKAAYKSYYDTILDRSLLSEGGQIIVDNVLLHGRVHTAPDASAESKKLTLAQKINDFNRHVAEDSRTTQTLLPIFDGLLLVRKK